MRRTLLLLLTGLSIYALAGCLNPGSGGPGSTSGTGRSAVPASLQPVVSSDESADPNASGVGADDEVSDAPLAAGRLAGPLALLPDSARIDWARRITSSNFTMSKTGTEDSMLVLTHRDNTGLFMGRLRRRARRDSLLYEKPYAVTWSRSAIYKRVAGLDGEEDTDWMLKSLTLAQAVQTSPPGQAPTILSVQVSGHDDVGNPQSVTFTDPNAMYDPNALPDFALGDSVTVRVITDGNGADQVAYIHFDKEANDHGRSWRRPLLYNGVDGAFEGSFKVREGYGRRHHHLIRPRTAVWVDVMTRDSIQDTDTGKYGMTGWGLPYRLARPKGHLSIQL